jgi:hypothetical protein
MMTAKTSRKPKAKPSRQDDENTMWSWFEDFVIDGDLLSFTDHAGIKLRGLPPSQVWDVFRGHYTRGGTIDVEKFATDLATWGPIASRIVEVQLEQKRNAAANA